MPLVPSPDVESGLMRDNPGRWSILLRGLSGAAAGVCAFTAVGSLAVCLFTLPSAWPMVILWGGLASLCGAFARRGRLLPGNSRTERRKL